MNTLTLYRSGAPTVTVDIGDTTEFSCKLMGERKIKAEFYSSVLDIAIGDYVTYNSENFYVNKLPNIKKINNDTYQYRIVFEGVVYDLEKKIMVSDNLTKYTYTGDASDFLDDIVANMNEYSSGWSAGSVPSTWEAEVTFANETCASALSRIASLFGLEWYISGKQISLVTSIGSATGLTFTYGKNSGLYGITRQQLTDKNITTKVYGFGGSTNISENYRSGAKCLVFNSRYLTNNTSIYGTIEGVYYNEDIYPKRESTLTSVNVATPDGVLDSKNSYIADSTIDFDFNSYKIKGRTMGIFFRSGSLAGKVYEIWKYDHSTKECISMNILILTAIQPLTPQKGLLLVILMS